MKTEGTMTTKQDMSPPHSAHPRVMFLNKSDLDEIPGKEFKSMMINPFIEMKEGTNS